MRLLLVDDHPMVLDAFESILERLPEHIIAESLTQLGEALSRLAVPPPVDLVLLDLTLPGHTGTSALTILQQGFPDVPVAVLSATDDSTIVDACVAAGVRGYLPKSLDRHAIERGLRALINGDTFIAPSGSLGEQTDPATTVAEQFGLTRRQVDVLLHLVQGKSNRDIALALNQSVNTTQVHVAALLHAIGASNRTEAVVIAARFGLLAPR